MSSDSRKEKKPAKCSNGLLEKPAAWVDEDAPCLAAAQMAQRPPTKRPREDALLEAERSHQRRRIELLDAERSHQRGRIELLNELLDDSEAKVERLEDKLWNVREVWDDVCDVSTALRTPATRSRRAELALRWFERDREGDVEKLVSEWWAELSRDVE